MNFVLMGKSITNVEKWCNFWDIFQVFFEVQMIWWKMFWIFLKLTMLMKNARGSTCFEMLEEALKF
jgi:hypothetical protein